MPGKLIKSYYFCSACSLQFDSKTSYDLHFESLHPCEAKLTPKENVTPHVETVHEKKKPFACQDCNKKFKSKINLKQHVEIVHEKKKPFACQDCDMKFTSMESLEQHVETVHEKKKTFTCLFCDNKFSDNHVLNSHVEMLHNTDYGRPVRLFSNVLGRLAK